MKQRMWTYCGHIQIIKNEGEGETKILNTIHSKRLCFFGADYSKKPERLLLDDNYFV